MSDATARSIQCENLKQADLLCGIGDDPETSYRATECQRVCSLANGALLGLPGGHRHCSRDRILEGTNPCLNGQEERN